MVLKPVIAEKKKKQLLSERRRNVVKKRSATAKVPEELIVISPEKMASLVHELQVHQVELEIQNEELRRIQAELERVRDKYVHLYDFAPVGYFTINEKGLVIEANLTAATLIGIERPALIGAPFSRFIASADHNIFYFLQRSLLKSETPQSCELRLMKRNGQAFFVHMEFLLIKESGSNCSQIRIAANDITESKRVAEMLRQAHDELEERVRKRTLSLTIANQQLAREIEERQQAEARLLKSKEMLQTVFDGISDPLVLLDKDMRVKVLNKSAVRYYGITEPLGVIGEFCYKAFKGEPLPCPDCKVPPAVLKSADMNFERQGFKDPLREEMVFLYFLQQENGVPAEIIYRISDITEKKVFDKRLIQNEKMASLGVLVSSIAHEINNPNAFITFNIPILKDYLEQLIGMIDKHDCTNPELVLFNMSYPEFRQDIFRLVSNIEHGSERISAFVANLKEFSRIPCKGKANRIDLAAVAEKAVAICREKVKKTVKSFTIDIPANFPRIQADPMALEQILINLLINAAQAADKEDSWVRLSAVIGRAWLDHTIIEVADNGCGIAGENINRIFDPFFSTKTHAEGTGLGLYVCHNLVTGFGGRIEVESAIGEFSIFRVMIPDIERRKEKRT